MFHKRIVEPVCPATGHRIGFPHFSNGFGALPNRRRWCHTMMMIGSLQVVVAAQVGRTQGNYLIVIGGAFLPSVMHTTGGWGTGRLCDCTRRKFERNRKCDSSVLPCLGSRNDPVCSSTSFVFLTLSIFFLSTYEQERTRGSGLASGWVTMPTSRCSSKLAHSRERDQ